MNFGNAWPCTIFWFSLHTLCFAKIWGAFQRCKQSIRKTRAKTFRKAICRASWLLRRIRYAPTKEADSYIKSTFVVELADLYFLRKEIYDGEVAKIYAYNFAMSRDLDLII